MNRRMHLGVMVALWTASALAAPAEPERVIALTADTTGRLRACDGCPQAGGDIARRAAVVAALRQKEPGILLLDAGNALIGPDTIAGGGRAAIEAYNILRYHAVHVSYRDFRLGKADTMALLAKAQFQAISANLMDEKTGAPLLKPYAIVSLGGEKLVLIAVSELPPGADRLPHIRRQLEGIKLQPPAEAIAQWLPKAKAEAKAVAVMYYGTAAGLAAIREKFGGELLAILVGGLRPSELPVGGAPPVLGAAEQGRELTRVRFGADGVTAQAVPVDARVEPDRQMQMAMNRFLRDPLTSPGAIAAPPAAAGAVEVPSRLEPGASCALGRSSANRAVQLTVHTVSVAGSYGALAAPTGLRLLCLDTQWENIIPLTLVREKQLPTEYRIPNLADHIYLVADGATVCRLQVGDALAGTVPTRDFRLERIGSQIRGNLVFAVPQQIASLELRYYDYAHGHMTLALRSAPEGAQVPRPIAKPQSNEVVEAAIYGTEVPPELAGRKAPQGMQFLTLDLRARSLFVIDADASAFDPKAAKGARMKIGTVADWKESARHIQLVVDGQYAYAPIQSTLDPEPRLLPDLLTGGRLTFLLPTGARSLELRCDFPNAATPGGAVLKPRGVDLPVAGQRPALVPKQPIVSIADDAYRVAIADQDAGTEFAGEQAGEDKKFFSVEVSVQNTGKGGEFFQSLKQLKYTTARGEQLEPDAISGRALHPPIDPLWIPAGQQRTFQLVYRIPAGERRPRMAFSGVSLAKVVELRAMEAGVVAPPPATAPVVVAPATAPVERVTPVVIAPVTRPVAVTPVTKPVAVAPVTRPVAPVRPPRRGEGELPRVTARQDRKPAGLAGVGLTPEQVNQAIDKGAAWLWAEVDKDVKQSKRPFGHDRADVLFALALVHAGAHKKFPECDVAIRSLLAGGYDDHLLRGYEAGLFCMLVESYGDPTFMPQARRAVRYLLEAQGPGGTWGYSAKVPPELFKDPAAEQVLFISGGQPLDGSAQQPWQRQTKADKASDGDNSVSQFALLGLHAASRSGLRMPEEMWKLNLAAARRRHGNDGGWAYNESGSAYGSMTCAGICSVAINRHELGEKDPGDDPQIEEGLAWLQKNWTVTDNPQSGAHHYYFLYSLERVGRILDTEFIGQHEWYPLGAKYLVDAQKAKGFWHSLRDDHDDRHPTSFALLFLTRATPSLKIEAKRGGPGTLKAAILPPPALRLHIILDASGSMLEEMDGKPKFDAARDAVAALIKELPETAEVGLRVYGHRKRAIEEGANEDTELLIAVSPLKREIFLGRLSALRARGKTPLAMSLKQTAHDLPQRDAKHPILVVLLTDGGEDTLPRQDPLLAADEVGKLKDVKLHVVGFDIGREDWSQQLQGIASRAGGRYYPAARRADLARELRCAVLGVPDSFAVEQDGKQITSGVFGQTKTLPEGKYRFCTTFAGQDFAQDFWINTERITAVTFNAAKVPNKSGGTTSATPTTVQPVTPPATPAKKFCTECGKPLTPGAKFCTGCGAKTGG